jgi:hypothetical protein
MLPVYGPRFEAHSRFLPLISLLEVSWCVIDFIASRKGLRDVNHIILFSFCVYQNCLDICNSPGIRVYADEPKRLPARDFKAFCRCAQSIHVAYSTSWVRTFAARRMQSRATPQSDLFHRVGTRLCSVSVDRRRWMHGLRIRANILRHVTFFLSVLLCFGVPCR